MYGRLFTSRRDITRSMLKTADKNACKQKTNIKTYSGTKFLLLYEIHTALLKYY